MVSAYLHPPVPCKAKCSKEVSVISACAWHLHRENRMAKRSPISKQTFTSTLLQEIFESVKDHNLETPFRFVSTIMKTGKPHATACSPQWIVHPDFTPGSCVTLALQYSQIFRFTGIMAHFSRSNQSIILEQQLISLYLPILNHYEKD